MLKFTRSPDNYLRSNRRSVEHTLARLITTGIVMESAERRRLYDEPSNRNVERGIGQEYSVHDLSRARYYLMVAYCKLSDRKFNLEQEER